MLATVHINMGQPQEASEDRINNAGHRSYCCGLTMLATVHIIADERCRPPFISLWINDAGHRSYHVAQASKNRALRSQVIGQAVTYGQTIQLLHVASGKFVSVLPKVMADAEQDCFKYYK